MTRKRYEMWAGVGIPKCWKDLGFEDPSGVVWPIVDSERPDPIDGSPDSEQWYAVAFKPGDQARICRLLNEENDHEEKSSRDVQEGDEG
jgi:hypothetical protein